MQQGVSLFAMLKLIFIKTGLIYTIDLGLFKLYYFLLVSLLFVFMSLFIIFIERSLWRRMMLLTSMMLLLPHCSSDYKLIYIFLPLYFFVNTKEDRKSDLFYSFLLGFLLIPKDYHYLNGILSDAGVSDISISMPINIVILVLISIMIIKDGLTSKAG
ncbi:MAG: hypothetical protein WCY05_03255, partial [Candidatus Omnitrophota bacterium]